MQELLSLILIPVSYNPLLMLRTPIVSVVNGLLHGKALAGDKRMRNEIFRGTVDLV
jgi:hypothetical protein